MRARHKNHPMARCIPDEESQTVWAWLPLTWHTRGILWISFYTFIWYRTHRKRLYRWGKLKSTNPWSITFNQSALLLVVSSSHTARGFLLVLDPSEIWAIQLPCVVRMLQCLFNIQHSLGPNSSVIIKPFCEVVLFFLPRCTESTWATSQTRLFTTLWLSCLNSWRCQTYK